MAGRAPLRKATPTGDGWRPPRRPAFQMPANDNRPLISRRAVAWVLMVLGFAAALAVFVGAGF